MVKCKNCVHYYKIFSVYANKWEHVCRMNEYPSRRIYGRERPPVRIIRRSGGILCFLVYNGILFWGRIKIPYESGLQCHKPEGLLLTDRYMSVDTLSIVYG